MGALGFALSKQTSNRYLLSQMALSKVPLIVLFCILSCIDSSAFGESVQGFAEEVNADVKFECPYSEKVVYTVSNQIQCHHKCLRMERCAILNFKQHGGGAINDNCEVYGKTDKESTCRSVKDMNGWTAIILEVKTLPLKALQFLYHIFISLG